MDKRHAKNTDLMAEALGDYIFNKANKIIVDLEYKEEFKEAATEFNKLPKLKRLLDFYIVNFWLASDACELYYEHDDFEKICEGIEEGIYESLESYEKSNQILGLTLKDFIKDRQESTLFYREYPVSDETKVNFRVLLSILIPKRFSDYHSTLSFKDETVGLQRRSEYFCHHIFGKENSVSPDRFILMPIFALILSSTFSAFLEYIDKLEEKIEEQVDIKKSALFLRILNNLTIAEEDCGTKNSISVSSLIRRDEIIKNFKERIIGRFIIDSAVDIVTNKIIVRSGDYITKEKAEIIEKVGISKIRVRSIFTCESEYGICLKCYGRYSLKGDAVKIGEKVGEEAALAWGEIEINRPLKDLLEARKPVNPSIICEIDGVAELADGKNGRKVILVTSSTGFKRQYHIPRNKEIKINNGQNVLAGRELTDGEINPHDALKTNGEKGFLEYMKSEILPYLSKVNFDERLVELLIRQMIKLKIEDIGDTSFKVGQTINRFEFMEQNIQAIRNGKRSASASPFFIGINLM